jgi:N-acetylmuramoyl-L-alanine amidase
VSCPAILAECGFLSNYSELDRLSDERYQTDLALILVGSFLQEQGTKQLS